MKYFTDEQNGQRVLVHLRKGPGLNSTLTFIDHKREETSVSIPIQLTGLAHVLYNRLPRSARELTVLAKECIELEVEREAGEGR